MQTKSIAKAPSSRQNPLYLDSRHRQEALDRIKKEPTVDITTVRCGLGIGAAVAYREAESFGGRLIGGRWIFATPKLREILGLIVQ